MDASNTTASCVDAISDTSSSAEARAQALIFLGTEHQPPVELRSIEIPSHLGAGQILAKIRMCTVCGSDLHTLSGKRQEACPR